MIAKGNGDTMWKWERQEGRVGKGVKGRDGKKYEFGFLAFLLITRQGEGGRNGDYRGEEGLWGGERDGAGRWKGRREDLRRGREGGRGKRRKTYIPSLDCVVIFYWQHGRRSQRRKKEEGGREGGESQLRTPTPLSPLALDCLGLTVRSSGELCKVVVVGVKVAKHNDSRLWSPWLAVGSLVHGRHIHLSCTLPTIASFFSSYIILRTDWFVLHQFHQLSL